MWKMTEVEQAKCHLCPACDSLGPHWAWTDEDSGQQWLDCIDCGIRLGSLTSLEPESIGHAHLAVLEPSHEAPIGVWSS